jgi:hypothetical protein
MRPTRHIGWSAARILSFARSMQGAEARPHAAKAAAVVEDVHLVLDCGP